MIMPMIVAIERFFADFRKNEKSFMPKDNPKPIIGPMSGEISIAPIIMAMELILSPIEAIKIANMNAACKNDIITKYDLKY